MLLPRRDFLQVVAASGTSTVLPHLGRRAAGRSIEAIAFDAFPVLDPRDIVGRLETLAPGRGAEFDRAWRARQFQYLWLRTTGARYADFERCTADALQVTATSLGIPLSPAARDALMGLYRTLPAWPDAVAALRRLRASGLRLAFCSNLAPAMLAGSMRHNGLDAVMEPPISTHAARTFKPDPRAYRLAEDAFGVRRDRILFVAFAAWDVAGASWFGFPTYWVNRAGAPAEALDGAPDGTGRSLDDLVAYVEALGDPDPSRRAGPAAASRTPLPGARP